MPASRSARAAGLGLRPGTGRAVAGPALRPGGASGRQRQLCPLAGPRAADPAQPAAAPLRAQHRAAARIPGRHGRDLQRPAPSGHLPAGGRAAGAGHGCVTTATRPCRWICGQRSALPTTPPTPQQRPTHALAMADKLTRSLHIHRAGRFRSRTGEKAHGQRPRPALGRRFLRQHGPASQTARRLWPSQANWHWHGTSKLPAICSRQSRAEAEHPQMGVACRAKAPMISPLPTVSFGT